MPKGDSRVLEAKKTIFLSRYRMSLFTFLFLDELGMCPQNLISRKGVDQREKNNSSKRGYVGFHIQRHFFDNKKRI
jgi:hypothetical protein